MNDLPLELIYLNALPLPSWPVAWGVPLPKDFAGDVNRLFVAAPDGQLLPTQTRVLATYDDGSPRRLLVHAEPEALPDSRRPFRLIHADATVASIANAADDTNLASADAPTLVGAFGRLTVAADHLQWQSPSGSARITISGEARPAGESTWSPLHFTFQSMQPFEVGPVAASVAVVADSPLLTATITLRAAADTPVLFADVLVKNLSQHAAVEVRRMTMRVELEPDEGAGSNAADHASANVITDVRYELRQRTSTRETPTPVSLRAKQLALETHHGDEVHTFASRLLSYNETWVEAVTADARLMAGARCFYEMFPWGIDVDGAGMTFDFWPSWSDKPGLLRQGQGRTHEIALAWTPTDHWLTGEALGYALCKPPMPLTPLSVHHAGDSLTGLLDYDADRYPRIETAIYDLVHNRNRGYGKMHHGDDYSVLYTNQLRGKGEIVWNNLEGDLPFHAWRQFVRSGQYLFFREFRDGIRHWADVDFADRHANPLIEGALIQHSADHATGGASPCHNWAEGFVEWYWATGDPRPREVLEKMAHWLVRQHANGFFKTEPAPYVRGCGWGLIQIAAIQQVLNRPDLETIARDLSARLLTYCNANDGLTMNISTGGSKVMKDNAFHTATVVIGAWRCWEIYRDDMMRDLALAAAEPFMDQRTCSPEGIAVYITGPEQGFPMQQAATFAMAALAVAWRLTSDPRYVRRGMRMLEYCLDRGMIVDHMRIPGDFINIGDDVVLNVAQLMPNSQLLNYQLRGLLLFMTAAHQAGMLKDIDYRY